MSDIIDTKPITRNQIQQFENHLKENYINELDKCTLKHYFNGGIYAREMTIPQGLIVTGAIHKYDHIVTISKGKGYLVDEFGGYREYEAPITFETRKGTKRAIQTISETIFSCYVKCEVTNPEEARSLLVCETVDDYNLFIEQEKLKIEAKI